MAGLIIPEADHYNICKEFNRIGAFLTAVFYIEDEVLESITEEDFIARGFFEKQVFSEEEMNRVLSHQHPSKLKGTVLLDILRTKESRDVMVLLEFLQATKQLQLASTIDQVFREVNRIVKWKVKAVAPTQYRWPTLSLTSNQRPTVDLVETEDGVIKICPREAWGAEPKHGDSPVLRKQLPYVIITHTSQIGVYNTTEECLNAVLEFQQLNFSMMFGDIAFNYLVGNDGTIYEGRGHSRESDTARGWNHRSIGIAFIGKYQDTMPSQAALDALKAFLKYLATQGVLAKDFTIHCLKQVREAFPHAPGNPLYKKIKTWSSNDPEGWSWREKDDEEEEDEAEPISDECRASLKEHQPYLVMAMSNTKDLLDMLGKKGVLNRFKRRQMQRQCAQLDNSDEELNKAMLDHIFTNGSYQDVQKLIQALEDIDQKNVANDIKELLQTEGKKDTEVRKIQEETTSKQKHYLDAKAESSVYYEKLYQQPSYEKNVALLNAAIFYNKETEVKSLVEKRDKTGYDTLKEIKWTNEGEFPYLTLKHVDPVCLAVMQFLSDRYNADILKMLIMADLPDAKCEIHDCHWNKGIPQYPVEASAFEIALIIENFEMAAMLWKSYSREEQSTFKLRDCIKDCLRHDVTWFLDLLHMNRIVPLGEDQQETDARVTDHHEQGNATSTSTDVTVTDQDRHSNNTSTSSDATATEQDKQSNATSISLDATATEQDKQSSATSTISGGSTVYEDFKKSLSREAMKYIEYTVYYEKDHKIKVGVQDGKGAEVQKHIGEKYQNTDIEISEEYLVLAADNENTCNQERSTKCNGIHNQSEGKVGRGSGVKRLLPLHINEQFLKNKKLGDVDQICFENRLSGTLTCFARNKRKEYFGLTALHVLCMDEKIGRKGSDGYILVGCCNEGDKGKIMLLSTSYHGYEGSYQLNRGADIAVMELSNYIKSCCDLTKCFKTPLQICDFKDIKFGTRVEKVGAVTDHTYGEVISTEADLKMNGVFCRAILLYQENFATVGDSGALVCLEGKEEAVGVVVKVIEPKRKQKGPPMTWCLPMIDCLDCLKELGYELELFTDMLNIHDYSGFRLLEDDKITSHKE